MDNPKVRFILKGFSHVMEYRVFEFERVTVDLARDRFTVRIDLGLARKYHIPQQEMPLLCRGLLEQGWEGGEEQANTYTEQEMRRYAYDAAARAETAKHKKMQRLPVNGGFGARPDFLPN